MANKTYKLGELLELYSERCGIPNLTRYEVSGVNRDKEFFEPSQSVGEDTSSYKIVPINYFACNLMHVGRDIVLPVAMNHSDKNKYVSPAYTVFKIIRNDIVLNQYLFIFLKSPSKDKYFWFKADSSVRDGMSWEDFCDIDITLPDLKTQEKYVEIYEALVENQKSYERGLDDLKLTCDAYIEELRRKMPCEKIGKYINEVNVKNIENKFGIESIRGISIKKEFTETKADTNDLSTTNYKIVSNDQFAFNPNTARMGEKICVAYNNSEDNYLVSAIYPVFKIIQKNILCAEYLMMFFIRSEFDRYVRFNSWGSARETFDYPDMCEVQIPIPSMEIQHSIVDVFKVYKERKEINEKLKLQIKDICPILIKGSLEEAKEA